MRIICIDAGSPRPIANELARLARIHDIGLVRTEHFLTPNEARNLALTHIDTEFVVFVDNDVVVEPGWLEPLEQCARETDAWIVGALQMSGPRGQQVVHHAGGDAHIDAHKQWFVESHGYQELPLAEAPVLERTPTEEAEFHCMLVRREVFERLGPLDEQLHSTLEHCDLSMQVREAGGGVWLEPESHVTFVLPRWVARSDRPYWVLRWCDPWTETSLRRFADKWHLADDDPTVMNRTEWHRLHRRYAYRPFVSPLYRMPGSVAHRLVDMVDEIAQRRVLTRHATARAASIPPRVVHRPQWMTAVPST